MYVSSIQRSAEISRRNASFSKRQGLATGATGFASAAYVLELSEDACAALGLETEPVRQTTYFNLKCYDHRGLLTGEIHQRPEAESSQYSQAKHWRGTADNKLKSQITVVTIQGLRGENLNSRRTNAAVTAPTAVLI